MINLNILLRMSKQHITSLETEINNSVEELPKIKRGRKSKKDLIASLLNPQLVEIHKNDLQTGKTPIFFANNNDIVTDNIASNLITEPSENVKPSIKKRGRKPKGGKIIQQVITLNSKMNDRPNIILHLKCSMKDLNPNNILNSDIVSYNFEDKSELSYDIVHSANENTADKLQNNEFVNDFEPEETEVTAHINNTKNISKKLKQLEHNLHLNNMSDKKSACFWCTYEFDNPPVYIPKYYIKDSYQVYGCFCSPECSVAYLMEENIDSSSKFERYHFINHIYGKIFNYTKNIKPAPNPYYMLNKFYGNLSIQEYRSLLRNERLFLIVDKPLTRVMPELHEDNDEFILNHKLIPSNNNYQVKKTLQKKTISKNNIFQENFGLQPSS